MIYLLLAFAGGLEFTNVTHLDLMARDIFEETPMVALDEERLLLYHEDRGQLLVMDLNGAIETAFGGKGQGPHEFQDVSRIQLMPGGKSLWITDRNNRRYSRWTTYGELLKSQNMMSDMTFVVHILSNGQTFFLRDLAGHFDGRPRLERGRLDQSEGETIWDYPLGKRMPLTEAANGEEATAILLQWEPRLRYDVGSDFIAIAWGDDPHLHLLDFNGDPIGEPFHVQLPQPPVTREQEQDQISRFPDSLRSLLVANMTRRDYWPPVARVVVDEVDRIWVTGFHRGEGEPIDVSVFTRKGKFLGRGELPAFPAAIHGDYVFYQHEREDTLLLTRARVAFD